MLTRRQVIQRAGLAAALLGPVRAQGPGQAGARQAGSIRRGGTLRVVLTAAPRGNFDPARVNDPGGDAVLGNVVEGLYKYDEQLRPIPWLAERIEQPDAATYLFHLRRGVRFHDDAELDAEAVRFSMERIRADRSSIGYADARPISAIRTLDRATVSVVLGEPFAPLPSRLTARLGAVLSPAAVEALGEDEFNRRPAGTGPFRFDSFEPGGTVRVTRFEGYWATDAEGRPLPYVDRVTWTAITDAAARLAALRSGEQDIAPVREEDVPLVETDAGLITATAPGLGWGGLWLTINRPPFDDRALRQAVAYALDRVAINREVYRGTRAIAHGPIPPRAAWAVDDTYRPYPHDLATARERLAEGGQPDGFAFEYWITTGDPIARLVADTIAGQLARVGIEMNIRVGDFNSVVIPMLMRGESNAYQLGLAVGLDPDQQIASAFETGGGFNFSPYSNPRLDALLANGRAVVGLEERGAIYKEAVRLIVADAPYIFTLSSLERFTGRAVVQGWHVGTRAVAGYAEHWLSTS